MERLLRYSFDHGRVIRLMYVQEDGKFKQVSATVVSYDDDHVDFVTTRSPRTVSIPMESLLSVDFKRGDDGTI